jgi:Mg-chelatase subunit ChlD
MADGLTMGIEVIKNAKSDHSRLTMMLMLSDGYELE